MINQHWLSKLTYMYMYSVVDYFNVSSFSFPLLAKLELLEGVIHLSHDISCNLQLNVGIAIHLSTYNIIKSLGNP